MTTRIGNGGPSTGVSASASAARVTAPPGQPFKAIMHASASTIMSGAEQALTRLPGGPILAAALRPAAGPVTAGAAGGMTQGEASPEGPGSVGAGIAAEATSSAPAATNTPGLESALAETSNDNLAMLLLQKRINEESRDYSAMSNVLKARHDTVKNAIGNIR
jgi:hypothetical protein